MAFHVFDISLLNGILGAFLWQRPVGVAGCTVATDWSALAVMGAAGHKVRRHESIHLYVVLCAHSAASAADTNVSNCLINLLIVQCSLFVWY